MAENQDSKTNLDSVAPTNNDETRTDINHMSIKIPIFSTAHCAGWFRIVRAQFQLAKVTQSKTKFYQCLGALNPDIVGHLPTEVLDSEDYIVLKEKILKNYEQSKGDVFDQLMAKTQLIGKPSQIMNQLQRLASRVGVGDDLVRHRFLQAMSDAIKPVLVAQQSLSLEQLANLADELSTFTTQSSINSVNFRNENSSSKNNYNFSNNNRSNSLQRDHVPLGVRPFYIDQKPKVCRGHLFYGEKSRTCKVWCKWPAKDKNKLKIEATSRPSSRSSSPVSGNEARD